MIKTVWALAILLVFYWLGRLARSTVIKFAASHSRNANFSALLSNVSYAIFIILGLLAILTIYTGAGLSSLLTLLGIFSLAISLSLQDVLKNFVAGVYILLEQPFKIGDTISVKGVEGIVESIEIRTTNLKTNDGIQIIIPNNTVFSEIVSNSSAYERRLVTVRVILPPGQPNFDQITERISRVLKLVNQEKVLAEPNPAIILESIIRDRTTLRVEFWTPLAAQGEVGPLVALAIQQELPEANVSIGNPPKKPVV